MYDTCKQIHNFTILETVSLNLLGWRLNLGFISLTTLSVSAITDGFVAEIKNDDDTKSNDDEVVSQNGSSVIRFLKNY